jgi:hypothetical protein
MNKLEKEIDDIKKSCCSKVLCTYCIAWKLKCDWYGQEEDTEITFQKALGCVIPDK